MSPTAQIAIPIVSYNAREPLLDCLASVMETGQGFELEVVVVDNASEDGSLDAVRRAYPRVRAIENRTNLGFGAACNQAIQATNAPYILLLNSDARLTPGALAALYEGLRGDERRGAIGCRTVNARGLEVANARYFLTPFNQALELSGLTGGLNSPVFCRTRRPRLGLLDCAVDWIDGACLMLK